MFTYETLRTNLKQVQRLFDEAVASGNKTMIEVWYNERARLLCAVASHPSHRKDN